MCNPKKSKDLKKFFLGVTKNNKLYLFPAANGIWVCQPPCRDGEHWTWSTTFFGCHIMDVSSETLAQCPATALRTPQPATGCLPPAPHFRYTRGMHLGSDSHPKTPWKGGKCRNGRRHPDLNPGLQHQMLMVYPLHCMPLTA